MIYEFRCHGCGRRFEVYATLKEKEAGLSPRCPRCGSADVGRVFTPVLFLRRGDGGRDAPAGAGEFDPGPGVEGAGAFGDGLEDDGNGDGNDGGWDEVDGLDGGGAGLEGDWHEGEADEGFGAFDDDAGGVDDVAGELDGERG